MGETRASRSQSDGEGSQVAQLERAFAELQGARFAIACASGTAALEVSLKTAGIGPGAEVIVPPYTFIATASAPMLLGATPVFCDIDADTMNLDPRALQAAITPRTRAIIPVHFAGRAADMDAILSIARDNRLFVLEDAAHGHGAAWKEKGLGSIGDAGAFSFQASRHDRREGGIIVTNDERFAEVCESYIWVGREASRPWYEHHRLGWNYRMTEFQAAILLEQLSVCLPDNNPHGKRRVSESSSRADSGDLHFANPPWVTRNAHHIFLFRFHPEKFGISRAEFLLALAAEGIPCAGGYDSPLSEPALRAQGNGWEAYVALCPNAEKACAEMIWLEHRLLLGSLEDMEQIVQAVRKIHLHRAKFQYQS